MSASLVCSLHSRRQVEEYCRQLLTLSKEYEWITQSYVVEFFVKDHWARLPTSWQVSLDSLTPPEVAGVLLTDPRHQTAQTSRCRHLRVQPLSLLAFRAATHALALRRTAVPPARLHPPSGRNPDLAHCYRSHVKPKKQHEIERLAEVIHSTCRAADCERVVDIGSGQGHLSRLLSFGYGLRVTSVEAVDCHVTGAARFDREVKTYMERKNRTDPVDISPPHHVVCTVNPSISVEEFLAVVSARADSERGRPSFSAGPREERGRPRERRAKKPKLGPAEGGDSGVGGEESPPNQSRESEGNCSRPDRTARNPPDPSGTGMDVSDQADTDSHGSGVDGSVRNQNRLSCGALRDSNRDGSCGSGVCCRRGGAASGREAAEDRFLIAGLHTCGDLGPTMLRTFAACGPAAAGLASVACCYMRMAFCDKSPEPRRQLKPPSSNLPSSNLTSSNLPSSNLPSSNLPLSNLPSSNLPSSNLPSSNLPSSNLPSSNLPSSNLPSSNLPSSNLPSSNLPSSNPPSSNPPSSNPPSRNLPSSNLPSSNLPSSNLPSSNLPSSNLPSSNLPSSNLPSSNLPSSNLPSSNLPSSNLPSSNLPSSNLPSSNLPSSNLPSSNLPSSNLPSSNLPSSNLPSSNLPSSNLPSSNPPQNNLPSSNLPSSNLPSSNLPSSNLPSSNPPQNNPPQNNPPSISPQSEANSGQAGLTNPGIPDSDTSPVGHLGTGGVPDVSPAQDQTATGLEPGFPMSAWVRSLCGEGGSPLTFEPLELACHFLDGYRKRLQENDPSLLTQGYRAVLEVLIQEQDLGLTKSPEGARKIRKAVGSVRRPHLLDFEEYACTVLGKLGLAGDRGRIRTIKEILLPRWHRLVTYHCIRQLLAPVVESLVLADRALFLLEKGIESKLVPVFDPLLSPRNLVLLATRGKTR